jgi:hypothetical protein
MVLSSSISHHVSTLHDSNYWEYKLLVQQYIVKKLKPLIFRDVGVTFLTVSKERNASIFREKHCDKNLGPLDPRIWSNCQPSKCWPLFISPHSVTSQKNSTWKKACLCGRSRKNLSIQRPSFWRTYQVISDNFRHSLRLGENQRTKSYGGSYSDRAL